MSGDSYPFPGLTGTEPCTEGDPERFFPLAGENAVLAGARADCASCPVREACLEYALHTTVRGVWGGTTTKERSRLRAQLGIVPEPVVSARVDHGLVYRMGERGASVDVIAAVLGVSPSSVARIDRARRAS